MYDFLVDSSAGRRSTKMEAPDTDLVHGVAVLDPSDDARVGGQWHDRVTRDAQVGTTRKLVVLQKHIDQPEELHHSLVLYIRKSTGANHQAPSPGWAPE